MKTELTAGQESRAELNGAIELALHVHNGLEIETLLGKELKDESYQFLIGDTPGNLVFYNQNDEVVSLDDHGHLLLSHSKLSNDFIGKCQTRLKKTNNMLEGLVD